MILAGDIGGTKTNLGLFSSSGERMVATDERYFLNRDYGGVEEVVEAFLKGKKASIDGACFGVAGPVVDGRCKTTNLPWVVDARRIGERFGISSVRLLNDLEAMAYGVMVLGEKDSVVLNPGRTIPQGNRAVIAAGTGLGESILFWDGRDYRPSASEGGHSDFGPRNAGEVALLEHLIGRFGHVSYERILSGPGLVNVYQFLKDSAQGQEPPWLSERLARENAAAVISEVGLSGKADLCVKALDLFVSIYGAEAGNLALKALSTGGLYVGGGIAPKIIEKLRDGSFVKAFVDKGRYSDLMRDIPVRVILDERAALLGAAHCASLQQSAR